jgi:protein AroM
MARLGVVTIGQGPRPDMMAELRRVVGDGPEVTLRGALDGLDRAAIDRLKPESGHDTLFTRLADGSAVIVSKKVIEERAIALVEGFARESVDATLMFCTGQFPALNGAARVVLPSAVLDGLADALLPKGRLGILIPLPEQVGMAEAKWARPGREVVVEPLQPSPGDDGAAQAAGRLAQRAPDLVVMDCMGYTQRTKDTVKMALGPGRTILAVSAAARAVEELLA